MGFAEDFVSKLQGLKFEDAFNPYFDTCPCADLPDAPSIRSETLRAIVAIAHKQGVDDVWIGRDLGYRGGRRTGLAFTDDATLPRHCDRWEVPVVQPTRGRVTESTASTIWESLDAIQAKIFLWNVFPLHPHEPGNPFSNPKQKRPRQEREAGKELLNGLIHALQPQRLIAVGNDAHEAVIELATGLKVCHVRHPSYGGKQEFLSGIRRLYA